MNSEFLPYARQSIDENDIASVARALQETLITRGPHVETFESEVAEYCGAQYAVAFTNGSAALEAACYAAKVDGFDRLISTPNTFVATMGSGVRRNAIPVFVDIDRKTGNLDLEQVGFAMEQQQSRGRSIVLPVHFSGIPVDMEKLDSLICNPNTIVIEDACHAIGSRYKDGQRVGCCAWSQMAVFSFHPAKTMTTGEGGIVTTNSAELDRRLRLFRNNGIERDPHYLQGEKAPWTYEVQSLTSNYNFTDMQAALGLSQLKRIESFIAKRRQLVAAYREKFRGKRHITLFTEEHDAETAFHLFVVQINFHAFRTTRTEVMQKLKEKNVGTQVHYIPLYRHPVFRKSCGDLTSFFPQTEAYYAQALSLPLYYDLSLEDIDRVVSTLFEVLSG